MLSIRQINQQQAKKSLPPYDTPMTIKTIPKIVDDTPGAVIVFDGWQNLPPQNLTPEVALDRAFKRSVSIQHYQIRNRLVYFDKQLKMTMIVKKVLDPVKVIEEQERRDKQSPQVRKTFLSNNQKEN